MIVGRETVQGVELASREDSPVLGIEDLGILLPFPDQFERTTEVIRIDARKAHDRRGGSFARRDVIDQIPSLSHMDDFSDVSGADRSDGHRDPIILAREKGSGWKLPAVIPLKV